MSSHHVVILGGGITGLSAAFHLARNHPTVQITVVEKSNRFGGWVRSERVEVCDSHENRRRVLLEAGPRTIRPNAKSILELVHLLDLRSEVICTPRASPAARNRFLYIPPGLQALPSGLLSLFTLPLGRLVLRSVLAEVFTPANHPRSHSQKRSLPTSPSSSSSNAPTTTSTAKVVDIDDDDDDDESVDSFFTRRFGETFARTLGSAFIHGIYAADSRQLSLLATFPQLRTSETRGNGSVIWGELGPPAWWWETAANTESQEEDKWEGADDEWETRFKRTAALFSFKEGMETLVRALVEALRKSPNVVLWNDKAVRRVEIDTDTMDDGGGSSDRSSFLIHLDGKGAAGDTVMLKATHVISALPLPVLDSILQPAPSTDKSSKTSLPHLRKNPHSSVTVLNLVFSNNPPNSSTTEPTTTTTPLHPPGFGYLIPRPQHGYDGFLISEPQQGQEPVPAPEPEPELGLLGVVFDTASLPEQDHDSENHADAAEFTKLTAMLGGPYLSAREESSSSLSLSDAQLVEATLRRISSHLGHVLPPPVHYAVHRNAESIPTYLVGHTARMGELKRALYERWGGRMKVIGAGVGGVSVSDCVKAGRQAASEVGAQIGN